jgi:hypothetical protein
MFILMFEHSFCWKYQYNEYKAYSKYLPTFIDLYSFIPGSGCVDMGPNVLLCSMAYNAVKTVLLKRTYMLCHVYVQLTIINNKTMTFNFRIIDGHIEFPYCRLFFDKSNKRAIKLETVVTWSKSNLNMMNIYEESTINFWICAV